MMNTTDIATHSAQLAEMSRYVREHAARFCAAGARLDSEYGIAAYRRRRAREICRVRSRITRRELCIELERQRLVQSGDRHATATALNDTQLEAVNCINALVMDRFTFRFTRNCKPSQWQLRTMRARTGLDGSWQPIHREASRGAYCDAPLERLSDAVRDRKDLSGDINVRRAEEIVLLMWLLWDRNTSTATPTLTDFQMLRWDWLDSGSERSAGGREVLLLALDEQLLALATVALEVVRASEPEQLCADPAGQTPGAEAAHAASPRRVTPLTERECGILRAIWSAPAGTGVRGKDISGQGASWIAQNKLTGHIGKMRRKGWDIPNDGSGYYLTDDDRSAANGILGGTDASSQPR